MNTNLARTIDQDPRLTDFQKAVYRVVADIPRGKTLTYRQVALAIGRPGAVRAVGSALNRNPFAPRVPCHRVVKSDGSLGGFAHGPQAKQALLKKEGVVY